MARVVAYYLPQFHNIPENDEWWGDGFTEWTNVRKATPLFDGHRQPRVPLDDNYYNLLSNDTKRWQACIAKEAGLYGFCYYHYWFDGKLLLERPMEQMLEDREIDFPFCICWANEPWTKSWVNETKVLIPQKYGSEADWRAHFDYLLPFFKDDRYIFEDNKPLLMIYRPSAIPCLKDMLSLWDKWARDEGFEGICYAAQRLELHSDPLDSLFKYDIERQPPLGMSYSKGSGEEGVLKKAFRVFSNRIEQVTGVDFRAKVMSLLRNNTSGPRVIDYREVWDGVINMPATSTRAVAGAFVDWDNTPRKVRKGEAFVNGSPELFEEYFSKLLRKVEREYSSDLIFINAWNEWAEGAYLEPDGDFGYGYLNALRRSIDGFENTND